MEPIYAVCWKYTYVLSSMHLFRFQYGDWGFCLGLIRLFQDLQKSCIFTFSGKLRPKIKTKHNIMKILLLWICKIYFPKERVLLSFVNGAEIDELFKCSLGRCPLVFPVVPWWPLCLSLPCGQSPVMPWPASRDRPHPYSVLGCRKSQWRGDGEINNADQSSWHAGISWLCFLASLITDQASEWRHRAQSRRTLVRMSDNAAPKQYLATLLSYYWTIIPWRSILHNIDNATQLL